MYGCDSFQSTFPSRLLFATARSRCRSNALWRQVADSEEEEADGDDDDDDDGDGDGEVEEEEAEAGEAGEEAAEEGEGSAKGDDTNDRDADNICSKSVVEDQDEEEDDCEGDDDEDANVVGPCRYSGAVLLKCLPTESATDCTANGVDDEEEDECVGDDTAHAAAKADRAVAGVEGAAREDALVRCCSTFCCGCFCGILVATEKGALSVIKRLFFVQGCASTDLTIATGATPRGTSRFKFSTSSEIAPAVFAFPAVAAAEPKTSTEPAAFRLGV